MNQVEQLRCKAIGYVWGLEDSRNEALLRIKQRFRDISYWDISQLFSQAYAEHVTSNGSYLDIRSAWESWATYGLIFFGYWDLKPEGTQQK